MKSSNWNWVNWNGNLRQHNIIYIISSVYLDFHLLLLALSTFQKLLDLSVIRFTDNFIAPKGSSIISFIWSIKIFWNSSRAAVRMISGGEDKNGHETHFNGCQNMAFVLIHWPYAATCDSAFKVRCLLSLFLRQMNFFYLPGANLNQESLF